MSRQLAVLIDGENISHRLYPQINQILQTAGAITALRVYADWSLPYLRGWKSVTSLNGIIPVHQFQIGKNSTDSALTMDAIELLHKHSEIDTFCIVSSDSDFCALCQKLRTRGKEVIGIGGAQSPAVLRSCCNKFHVIGREENRMNSNIITRNVVCLSPRHLIHQSDLALNSKSVRQISALCGG